MVSLEEEQVADAAFDPGHGATVLRFHRRSGVSAQQDAAAHLRGGDVLTRPLDRILTALGADHVSLVRWHANSDDGEVAAVTGAAVLAPGMRIPLASSVLLTQAIPGEPATSDEPAADGLLEALAAANGLETAMAVALHADIRGTRGALYLAWAGEPATPAAAQWVVAAEAHALDAMLEPPAIVGAHVVICHHERLVAEGIARQAERQLGVTAHACAELPELMHALERGRPDLIACSETLCDGAASATLAARVRDAGSAAPLLMLARAETARSIDDALRAGTAGYVAVTQGPERIMEVMAAVLDGRSVVPSRATAAHAPDLTPREREVLEGLDRGLSYVAIANELQVAPSTVKSHARQLFRKLEVGSRTAALHRARSEGLL